MDRDWIRTGGSCGLAAALLYLTMALVPLPPAVGRLLFFAWPVLSVLTAVGLHALLRAHRDTVTARAGALFAVIGGAVCTTMAVVQNAIWYYANARAPRVDDPELRAVVRWVLQSVHAVQLGLDVTFDIFFLLGFLLMAAAMLRHPVFGRVFGGVGIVLTGATLALNLRTFPVPPEPDLGPLVGLWALAVSVRMLLAAIGPAPTEAYASSTPAAPTSATSSAPGIANLSQRP